MIDFFTALSDILYVFLIVSSVLFGASVAGKILVIKTLKNTIKESDKNFDKIEDNQISSKLQNEVNLALERYLIYSQQLRKNAKIIRGNKVKKFLGLTQNKEIEVDDNLKDIFLSLFKQTSSVFEGSEGYLNYSKNELISMLKSLCNRLGKILDSSKVIWFKSIKISTIVQIISLSKFIEDLTNKTSVIATSYVLEFMFFVASLFSPVSAGKKLTNKILGDSFSSTLAKTIITIIGKEWAVLCYEKHLSRMASLENKKIA